MEQRAFIDKYKNIQFYESKYISSKKKNNEFELINEKKCDYIIKRTSNNSKNKDNSNGSRNKDNIINKLNKKNNSKNNFYNTSGTNYENNINYNNEDNNNGGNISLIQNTKDNNQNNNKLRIISGNNIIKYINNSNNIKNNNQLSNKDSKKFSNVAKVLKNIGNRDNSNINIIQENNSRIIYDNQVNKNSLKKKYSTEKIKIKQENDLSQNTVKGNFNIQMNNNKNKMSMIEPEPKYYNTNNKIWSHINKDLVPTKEDLKFEVNNEDIKPKTQKKYKDRFYRNNFTEKNNEINNNKVNGGENNINQSINDEDNYDTEDNNRNFISYKIKIKDIKELSKQKKDDNSNLKHYKSNNNIKVTYDQGRRSNKNIKDNNTTNKIQTSQIQSKDDKSRNLANTKNTTNTKSSPNFLMNENKQKEYKNIRSPKLIKDNPVNYTANNSNNGNNIINNKEENKLTSPTMKNLPLYEMNYNTAKDIKSYENSINRIFINKNRYKMSNNEKDQNEANNTDNKNIKERIRELKQIMNYNKRFTSKNDESNNENGLKVDNRNVNNSNKKIEIKKNLNFFQQPDKETNRIIFHKKVSKSPANLQKKANITSDNIDTKDNFKSIIKINYRNTKNNNIINNVIIPKDNYNSNDKIEIKYDYKKTENLSKTNNRIIIKENLRNLNILNDPSISNGNNGKVYIRHKALKKISIQSLQSKDKLDNNKKEEIKVSKRNKINSVNINNIYENNFMDNLENYPQEKIKNKIALKYKKVIKYYDFFIRCPKIEKCAFTNIFFKIIKYPKIDICEISKFNSVVYVLYKNKNVCYITKTRERIIKITQPPINPICEYSKNIILNYIKQKNDEKNNTNNNNDITKPQENKEEDNKKEITTTKKTKKRKKRRKTRKLHKEDANEKNNNLNNLTETKKENTDITSKELSKDETEKEKNVEENIPNIIPDSNIHNLNNININIKTPEETNIISIPKKFMTNDKSSQEEKSVFSDREMLIDIDKNSNSIKKKLSPTTYNDEEFNEEENDDFRIASDDDDLSDDKLKKKQFDTFDKFENGKTEGKEIIGDYDINKGNLYENEKNKMKYREGFKLLEKLNDKRIMNDFNEIEGEYNYNDMENINEEDDLYYDNNDNMEENERNNEVDKYNENNLNKNIILGADKLNLIFNNQKSNKFPSEEENENENYDDIYTDSNANLNYSENENNNYIFDKKKNFTYKNKYEKIGSVFDKLEEIFDRKREEKNISEINVNKYKTPILSKGAGHTKNRISDFNLQPEDYAYNEYNEIEISNKKKNTYKKEINLNKFEEIFNKQQKIISKLELLMNKPKSNLNQENSNLYNINSRFFNYNSPKIELETDSDININKDTPGNRKEMRLFKLQPNSKNKYVYSLEEFFSYKSKNISKNSYLLPKDVLNHCDSIIKTLEEEYSSFKVNYKEIKINSNNEPKASMELWARKDMSKEIEKAEKYVKELNFKMSNDNFRHKIIEILNTLTVDNYKTILNNLFIIIFLEENNTKENNENNKNSIIDLTLKNYTLNKPEYLLHNQFIFIEIVLEKATKEKGYVVLYAKLCADLFIEFIKYVKDINNPEIENQLINGENLKTILTSECRQKFDECISMETLYKTDDKEDNKEIFLTFKKKFLGNMDFIAELINVKLLSQTKGFEFLDILYKRFCEIKNEKIKYLNLEGAVILLTKFGKIVYDRKNPKHLQNLDNYMKDNMCPLVEKKDINLPNYLKFKIINLIEKKKNNWKDSLYEQSIIAKGKNNNNISIYQEHEGTNNNINIDESLMENNNKIINANNNTNLEIELEKENNIIILIKNDLENYVSYLNENQIFSLKDLIEQDTNGNINNEYDWSMTEELILKENNNLEEIIRCYIEVCIDYVQKEQNIFYCNEYIKNIINYYSVNLSQEQIDKIRNSMIDLFLNIENICIDNFWMFEIMGYLLLLLLDNYLFLTEYFDKFLDEDKSNIDKIIKVVNFTKDYYSEDKRNEFFENLGKTKLFENNKELLEE